MMNLQMEENTMPAFMVAFVRIEDQEAFNAKYIGKAKELVDKYGGETVAMEENPKAIEGNIPEGRLVILKFPSKQHAEGFYNDPEYQPLKQARQEFSQSDSTIIERGF